MAQITCQSIINSNADLWKQATEHPFLQQCKDATIPPQSFNWWLQQDFGFGGHFQDLAGALVAQAPRADAAVLQEGLNAMDSELEFFQVRV